MAKIVPSERLRRELDEVLEGAGEHDDPVEAVARLGARLILQQALEDEVTEFLGRARYQRADSDGGAIYRNGYEPRTVKTTSGPVQLERPRIRNAAELGFESQVLGKGVARTHALEALIILGGILTLYLSRSCSRSMERGDLRMSSVNVANGGGLECVTPVQASADTYPRLRTCFVSNGRTSSVGERDRAEIVRRFEAIDAAVPIATTPTDGLVLAELLISTSAAGDVIECGAFAGGSSAKLSIVAAMLGKTLHVYDSFEGLPVSDADDLRDHHTRHSDAWVTDWETGRYAARLDQVSDTIARHGELESCRFVEGWFEDTLVADRLPTQACLVFSDVDVASSALTSLTRLWPLLSCEGVFASHDVAYIKVLQALMSEDVWTNTLQSFPPILFGAGFGVGDGSPHLGYFVKGEVSAEYLKRLTVER